MTQDLLLSTKSVIDNFENRRKYPRIAMGHRANLILPDYQSIRLDLHDLSACALQIRFDAQTEGEIRTVIGQGGTHPLPELDVRFNIDVHDREEEIYARCQPVYLRQIDQDTYAMGMKFVNLLGKYQMLIDSFIESSLEPQ